MKQSIVALALGFLSLPAFAQQDNEIAETAADSSLRLEMKDTSGYTGNAPEKKFVVNREKIVYRRVFKVNNASNADEVFQRAQSFARLNSADQKIDKKKRTLTFPVTWRYHGGFNECIEDMELQGELAIEVKGTKTRISLQNLKYRHLDRRNGQPKTVAKSDLFSRKPDCAPVDGQIELLYNCASCPQSLESVTDALKARFNQYASQYQDSLRWY